jgi:aspartate/methionine/tyrosine aminotransferase
MMNIPGFREVPHTGVIYVMQQAAEHGYTTHHPDWANLGQGAPEIGEMPGAPPRISQLQIDPHHHEYSPTTGQLALRRKVADLYNTLFRQGKSSQYTYENVSISGGGRVALTRIVAALGNINMGHFLPDYTAYEELLAIFKAFIPIPILIDHTHGPDVLIEHLKNEISGRGLKALLLSNPCNPTGNVIAGDELNQLVNLARDYRCSMIIDEFYSHYIYNNSTATPNIVSVAEHVGDVNSDPVIIIDGITKNWRYPGWRISWTVGPKEVINAIASAGSFLDGGANHPFQKEVLQLLEPQHTLQETNAIQTCFIKKRDYVLKRLQQMGIQVESAPQGTFYIWANLAELPEPLNDGMSFFEAGLKENVITVPGIFFDVNPGKRRTFSRFRQYSRISFGPEMPVLIRGLDAIERMIKKFAVNKLARQREYDDAKIYG